MSDISKNIKGFRKKKGLTQEELAGKLNVTRQTVSSWEMSKSYPDLDMVVRLAQVLDTDPNCLLYPSAERKKRQYRPVACKGILAAFLGMFLAMTVFGGFFGMLIQPIVGSGVSQSYLYPIYGGIMILGALAVGCTCVILDEIRNGTPPEDSGEIK